MSDRRLVVITSLPSLWRGNNVRITRKMITGLMRYVELYPGPVEVILPLAESAEATGNLDDEYVAASALPFQVAVLPLTSDALRNKVKDAGVVLGGADYRLLGMAKFAKEAGVPYVFNSEYSLKTRSQIVLSGDKSPLRKGRALLWEWQMERGFVQEVKDSAGLQANGVPTYEAYRHKSRAPLLYFDTRIEESMLANEETIERKSKKRKAGGPLRLAFSGRLSPMKGADDLPKIAQQLNALGVDFELDICGAGPSEPAMRQAVSDFGLESRVRFRGVLNFKEELVPFLTQEIDLFVCPHKQGDPSCTYLETFSTGVPIAGYDNEAFRGLMGLVEAGFLSPMGNIERLARTISELAEPTQGNARLSAAAHQALVFSREHTFDTTFARRVQHLVAIKEAHSPSASNTQADRGASAPQSSAQSNSAQSNSSQPNSSQQSSVP